MTETDTPTGGPITTTRVPSPPVTETPVEKKSKRDTLLWVMLAVTILAVIFAVVVLVVTPRNAPATPQWGTLDHVLMEADRSDSDGLPQGPPVPLPAGLRSALEPKTLPANADLPSRVTMRGRDACQLAGGILLLSDPVKCSVDIPSVIAGGGR